MTANARAVTLENFDAAPTLREFEVQPPADGQLGVAVECGGICGTDLHLSAGHLPVPLPIVLGHEGLGIVDEIGPGAEVDALGTALHPGDRVMWASSIACGVCAPCRQHREPTLCESRKTYGVNRTATLDMAPTGAWADYIALHPGTTVVAIPDALDTFTAMSLACAGPTLVHALYERRPVRLGETVIVQGCGPVGLAAAAMAQLSGASLVVLVGGPKQRLDIAAMCGIGDHHLNIIDEPNPGEVLESARTLTGGTGADLVIECTGVPSAVAEGMNLVRRGGSYLIIGQYTDAGETSINPHRIVHHQLDVVGSWAFSGAHLVEYVRLLPVLSQRFNLAPLVTAFPLEKHAEAMSAVSAGTVLKAVLTTGAR